MKRRSFLATAAAGLFGGFAAMPDPLSRCRAYFAGLGFGPRKAAELAEATQRTAADFASFSRDCSPLRMRKLSDGRMAMEWLSEEHGWETIQVTCDG